MKRLYVYLMRTLRAIFRTFGLLSYLERRGETSPFSRWLRSLFAIYDIDDLIKLDLPWWTLEATEFVECFLKANPGARVFEYGSGASSFWLARRGADVTSVEHDADWFKEVATRAKAYANIELKLVPPTDLGGRKGPGEYGSGRAGYEGKSFETYVRTIETSGGRFDLIVIDGRARSMCLRTALTQLTENGLILFDNAARARYQAAINEVGLNCKQFKGLAACLPYRDATYVFSESKQ